MGEYLGIITSANDKCFVIKTKSEISAQDGLCFVLGTELIGCLVNSAERTKDGIKIYPNKKLNLQKGVEVYRNLDVQFNKTLENSKTYRKLDINFIPILLSLVDLNPSIELSTNLDPITKLLPSSILVANFSM